MSNLELKLLRILELIGTDGFMTCKSNDPDMGDCCVVIKFGNRTGSLEKAQELHRLLNGIDSNYKSYISADVLLEYTNAKS